ncbi:tail fiber protein [Myxococcota bacterium]|nr:tail fiber protein [Myxococcota bacterium]MBU1897453.1 tail fiber protein [Myxococcota bacterium]
MEPFIGEICIFGGNFAPRGWAFCDGQLLPIAQNAALFSILGTTYGGDGRTTFALPDLRGRLACHPGRGPGLTERRLGQAFGAETITLQEAQIPSHSHGVPASAQPASDANPRAGLPAVTPDATYGAPSGGAMNAASVAPSGGGQAHDNLQPFLVVNYIIALQGLYPSRG